MKKFILCTILLLAPAFSVAQQFLHVVYIVQENRTPDNLFGYNTKFEPGVDIASTGLIGKGQSVPLTSAPLASCFGPSHTHNAFIEEYAKGTMTGFSKMGVAGCSPGSYPVYKYVDNSSGQIQPYFDMALQGGFANAMFQTNQGPSFPAHQWLISGSSSPTDSSTLQTANNPPISFNGCGSAASVTVEMIDSAGNYSSMYPCFNRSTLVDLLEANGLTWGYYAVSQNSIWNAPSAITKLCGLPGGKKASCTGSEWANVHLNPSQVLLDIQSCNLPNVTWITPTGANSDHAQTNTGGGPSWVASVVNAIGTNCGYWDTTAIFITWDDWGGWYDHVAPTIRSSDSFGFRVPLLVLSSYTPAGYVGNTAIDFGSLLLFSEKNFGLGFIGPGNFADSSANNVNDYFSGTKKTEFRYIQSEYDSTYFLNQEDKSDPDDD